MYTYINCVGPPGLQAASGRPREEVVQGAARARASDLVRYIYIYTYIYIYICTYDDIQLY